MKKLSIIHSQLSIASTVILLSISIAYAQEIRLHFPHFSGQQYDWKIFQGEKELTVQSGKIFQDGQVTLSMPKTYQDYRGMTRWLLKSGGGLDMIYTGKGFSVECLSDKPGPGNIIYTRNLENDYLVAQHRRQQTILDKLEAVSHVLQVYPHKEDFHRIALKEQINLRLQFEQTQKERSKSHLYAARFGEIVDFTRGVADKIYENQEDHIRYFNNFVTYNLKFMDLYTSGHWDQVLHHWVMMNINSQDGDEQFRVRLNTVFKRVAEDHILAAVAQKCVPLLVQKGKDDLLPVIVSHLDGHPDARAKLSDNVKKMMASVKILTGKKAPDLVWKAPILTQTIQMSQDIILKTDHLDADYTILLFYQGDCQLCEDALIDLANKYIWLASNNVRVIAVSGDVSKKGFQKKLAYHQWSDNYCDLAGMGGANFKNYAVLGVPTLYLLDKKGIVLEKTATVEDLLKAIKTKL
ncbi:MAG: peroxiredoxin family protein [Desulfobacula sp.]|uniref:peroxiredoxin family protein n=1 Tax=Desulfobacula sp. TaxID=2593537 RepID=UPI0025BBFAB2|nr:redoxin domain-containing protein [Desulfobacula sp.]MCD4722419.1 peroxiredoxin family protein [Desulfobacula sp.]